MAVAVIKKAEIIGLLKDRESFLERLQKLGRVQLVDCASEEALPLKTETDGDFQRLEEAIAFLAPYGAKPSFLENMAGLKPVVYEEHSRRVLESFDWRALLNELDRLRSMIKERRQKKENLRQRQTRWQPWQELNVPLAEVRSSDSCDIFLGTLSRRDYALLCAAGQSSVTAEGPMQSAFHTRVSQDQSQVRLLFVCLKPDREALESRLREFRWQNVEVDPYPGRVSEYLAETERAVAGLEAEIAVAEARLGEMSQDSLKLKIIVDRMLAMHTRHGAERSLERSEFTFTLRGWIDRRDVPRLEKVVADARLQVALFLSDPAVDDNPPVLLRNRRLFEPFEFITQIYGMPLYGELDPTPFLAPFFFLYFGFCVSDVAYGLLILGASVFALRRFRLGPTGNRFWRMFFYCSLSTIAIGALTGSWFGNLLDILPPWFSRVQKFKDSLVILDPLKESTLLLGIALTLGMIQVWFGNVIAGIGNFKNRRYADILLDQVPTLTFLFGVTGLAMGFLNIALPLSSSVFSLAALAGAVALIMTQGRSEKTLGGKLFFGIYNFYGALSGYLSDILSYSRLWALGLVTGVMASTINLISVQFSQLFSALLPGVNKFPSVRIIVAAVILVAIFVAGHLISLLMNLLGAFVHPLRLQFVEFFPKFFKSGGVPFKPFKMDTRYLNIE